LANILNLIGAVFFLIAAIVPFITTSNESPHDEAATGA
jgi:hypothetical protein